MASGYLKEPDPFSAGGERNLPKYFGRGNVSQTMTAGRGKEKSFEGPKSASSENSGYAKKSLLILQHQNQEGN